MDLPPPYPISMRKFLSRPESSIYKLDKKGVLLYKIPYTNRFDYYPVDIAQFSLAHYEEYLSTKSEYNKEFFMKNVKWLYNNLVIENRIGVWKHNFELPYGYNFRIPWVHGMAQSLGMSALLRASFLTGEEIYKNVIPLILKSFEKEIEGGGVKFVDNNGNVWFEEYGVIPPTHILNGFMFILIGLWEVDEYLGIPEAEDLLISGLETLKKNLDKYDMKVWSLYDLLHKYPAPENYHNLHILQLQVLHDLTGDELFLEYSKKWREYKENHLNKLKVKFLRGRIHIKKLGVKGVIKRYIEMRRYFK